jgi:hypothetical protein
MMRDPSVPVALIQDTTLLDEHPDLGQGEMPFGHGLDGMIRQPDPSAETCAMEAFTHAFVGSEAVTAATVRRWTDIIISLRIFGIGMRTSCTGDARC